MMGFLICKDKIISSVTNLVDVAVNAMTVTSGMAFSTYSSCCKTF